MQAARCAAGFVPGLLLSHFWAGLGSLADPRPRRTGQPQH